MKKLLYIIFIIVALFSCGQVSQPKLSRVLVVKNFLQDHPQWHLLNDTIVRRVLIGYKGLELPVEISWRRAEDENGCLKIAILQLTQVGGDTNIILRNFSFTHNPCIYKKGYQLVKKYEQMDIGFEYFAKTLFREYRLKTNLGSIYGDGTEIFNRVYFLDKGGE
ncbi:MAG: hypothetical protein WCH59_10825 [Chitinophagia bacterium]|jgi:hypothetical protein|nr:hypothetical protein [Chitinophagia bacterium]